MQDKHLRSDIWEFLGTQNPSDFISLSVMGDPADTDFTRIMIDLTPEMAKEVTKIVNRHI
jgi:hypothetical protein